MAKLYNKNIQPACEYCRFGRPAPDADAILCVKKGILRPDSSCGSFRYDPLRRKPKPKAKIYKGYSPDDFKL